MAALVITVVIRDLIIRIPDLINRNQKHPIRPKTPMTNQQKFLNPKDHMVILKELKAFLNQLPLEGEPNQLNHKPPELSMEIRRLVYDMEDTIDNFTVKATIYKNLLNYMYLYDTRKLLKLANHIHGIQERVNIHGEYLRIRALEETRRISTARRKKIEVLDVRKDPRRIVGFEDEANIIICYLMEETEELDVITIVGMPGLGKTTLAAKIFRDPKLTSKFTCCIWVNVSNECRNKDVLLTILRRFLIVPDGLMSEGEIAKVLREQLELHDFLLVLNDVWSTRTWVDLSEAIPKTNRGSKVLITSQKEEVALEANPDRAPHKLRFFTVEESWELLRLEVFGKPFSQREGNGSGSDPKLNQYQTQDSDWVLGRARLGPHPDLAVFGAHIVNKCQGLPLAITAIGRILLGKALSKDTIAVKNAWRKVSESLPTYLKLEDTSMANSFFFSYCQLPYYLRPCFLYLGMFPEDYNIPVSKLIRLWIAEGFIQHRKGATLEQTGHDYLGELVRRNLVLVTKMSTYGQIKSCRLHYMLHLFCKDVAGTDRENFFQEIRASTEECFEPPVTKLSMFRRLCIHSNVVDFISSHPCGPLVRSLLCFSKQEQSRQPLKEVRSITAAFKLLKILDAEPIYFTKFPRDLCKLVNLTYIVLSSNFKFIPESLSKLWNVQTLIIYTTSRTLEIKANIWKMMQLRHVKTNASSLLPGMGRGREGKNLQTLGTISPRSCKEDLFDRVYNLRKLGIRGLISELLNVKGLDKLQKLEKLKLVNDIWNGPADSQGISQELPYAYAFPPNLRRITLCATYLAWSEMSKLEMLDNLEVLKVKENAFIGPFWEARAGGFSRLEVLHIECTDLVIWVAEAYQFPRLRSLLLKNCQNLIEIPHTLSKVTTLQFIDLAQVTDSVVASARKIKDAKKQQQKQGYSTASKQIEFQLCIDDKNDNLSTPGDSLTGKGKQHKEV